jgi:hypothetical protein
MQRNTTRRTLGIAGVLALGNIAIAYAQQQTAPPASGTSTPPAPTAATAPVARCSNAGRTWIALRPS